MSAGIPFRSRPMSDRRCRYCNQPFRLPDSILASTFTKPKQKGPLDPFRSTPIWRRCSRDIGIALRTRGQPTSFSLGSPACRMEGGSVCRSHQTAAERARIGKIRLAHLQAHIFNSGPQHGGGLGCAKGASAARDFKTTMNNYTQVAAPAKRKVRKLTKKSLEG
jgi:hypothetical protein